MSLLKFEPLKSIAIPNVGQLPVAGLTVVAGPNSSGKTQLLKDIQAKFLGEPRSSVVCSEIDVAFPQEFEDILQGFIASGQLKQLYDTDGMPVLQTTEVHLGNGQGGWRVRRDNLMSWHTQFARKRTNDFIRHIGQLLITSLFLERRLVATNETATFDYQNTHPSQELHALHMSPEAQRQLTSEIARTFGKSVWVDSTRGNVLCIRVSDQAELPSAEDRLQPYEMQKYRTIEAEGDGLKSYVCICMSLLLGRRPVQLIDEPEMCLHPPQAHALGRFIGKHAISKDQAVFVATHSSHVLRGIIETTSDLRILRMSRTDNRFHGKLIPYSALKACIDRPSTKAETILDGVFAEAVTIVESEGDRIVYSAATDNVAGDFDHDVHFVSVGGIGGMASTANLYRQLQVPQVVIADLDLLIKADMLKPVVEALGEASDVTQIMDMARSLAAKIKAIGPLMSADELKKELSELANQPMDWDSGHDEALRRRLSSISDSLSRSALLKQGGVANFENRGEIHSDLLAVLSRCRQIGLFLAPVGELEYWEPDLMNDGPSKKHKAEWANEAALRIRRNGKRSGGIHDFVTQMCRYQQDLARRYAGYPI